MGWEEYDFLFFFLDIIGHIFDDPHISQPSNVSTAGFTAFVPSLRFLVKLLSVGTKGCIPENVQKKREPGLKDGIAC